MRRSFRGQGYQKSSNLRPTYSLKINSNDDDDNDGDDSSVLYWVDPCLWSEDSCQLRVFWDHSGVDSVVFTGLTWCAASCRAEWQLPSRAASRSLAFLSCQDRVRADCCCERRDAGGNRKYVKSNFMLTWLLSPPGNDLPSMWISSLGNHSLKSQEFLSLQSLMINEEYTGSLWELICEAGDSAELLRYI